MATYLGCSDNSLTDEGHVEEVRTDGEDLYPGPQASAQNATNCSHSQALFGLRDVNAAHNSVCNCSGNWPRVT